ncbi:dTDP-4-dehydrorhamnose reductase [Alkalimarinus alittae]|uniref:dTDP-4-dehydrorhamnose reductase n=1 Tax=Alkalimarinus alittae TaxID=2961619 RepID=A0ABY6MZB9_9ALTE|nr:dTDP-4-dehydrorhamnose reductase [Alkalimarinus alittae]UZE95140.1 dTDP-4-dehydrorhamnose reductase [Alkalimarinus alittae]
MMKKVLITGAKGQVGVELMLEAAARGYDAVGYDSSDLDITDAKQVFKALETLQPQVVINAAAYTAVDKAEQERDIAFAVNADGVSYLADACKRFDVPLLHISTDYVFDGKKSTPYLESDEPNAIGVYGASKLAGEQVLKNKWHKHIILRVSWVFGAHGHNFVKTMLRLAESRDALSVVNDQYGAPTAAKSIASCLLSLVECEGFGEADYPWGLYHYQSEPGVTWYDFANEIFLQANALGKLSKQMSVAPITSEQFPTPVARPENSKLDGEQLKQVFGIQAGDWKRQLSEMLKAI